jgi:hypothetical protein
MQKAQLTISPDLRPFARPFRPLAVMGLMLTSWVVGCALGDDTKDDARSGLAAGGPVLGCFMSAKIDCPLQCAEIDFDAVCDATLGAACDGQCGAEATGTCLDSCNADCNVGCAASGDVSCFTSCDNRCGDNCQTLCAGAWNSKQCVDTCNAQCDSSCADNCQKRTDASCDGTCGASCNATCTVEAHVACQIKCSVDGFTTCKARVAATCVAECSSAVMLTCSDVSAMPDEAPPVGELRPPMAPDTLAPAAQPWSVGAVDRVGSPTGFARSAALPGEEVPSAPPPVEAPRSAPDASTEPVQPREEPRRSEGSDDDDWDDGDD